MKLSLTAGGIVALGALAALGVLWYKRDAIAAAAGQAARTVGDAVNPASSGNVVNRAVSAVGATVTGDADWSLGGQLAEWFSPSVRAANESLRTPPAPPRASTGDFARLDRQLYYEQAGRADASGTIDYADQFGGWGVAP